MLGYVEVIKLGISYGKVLVPTLENVDGITLGFDVETKQVSLDGSFDGYNDGKLERLLIGDSLGYTHGKVFGAILGYVDGIILTINDGTELGSLDGSFNGSNYGKL